MGATAPSLGVPGSLLSLLRCRRAVDGSGVDDRCMASTAFATSAATEPRSAAGDPPLCTLAVLRDASAADAGRLAPVRRSGRGGRPARSACEPLPPAARSKSGAGVSLELVAAGLPLLVLVGVASAANSSRLSIFLRSHLRRRFTYFDLGAHTRTRVSAHRGGMHTISSRARVPLVNDAAISSAAEGGFHGERIGYVQLTPAHHAPSALLRGVNIEPAVDERKSPRRIVVAHGRLQFHAHGLR